MLRGCRILAVCCLLLGCLPVDSLPAAYLWAGEVPSPDGPASNTATSDEPTSDEPTSDEPTSDGPTTDEPTTDEPTTDEPTTDGPTSEENNSTTPAVQGDADAKTLIQRLPALGPAVPGTSVPGQAGFRYAWDELAGFTYRFSLTANVAQAVDTLDGSVTFHDNGGAVRPATPRGGQRPAQREATGTGFVVHPQGILVTCAHVVNGAARIDVRIADRDYAATTIAVDLRHDLALLRVDGQDLPCSVFGESSSLRLAQEVRALGYPLSDLLGESLKVTRGAIAGINQGSERTIQVDAAVNAGNSGGPLLDEFGRVVGVINQKLVGHGISSVGFAIPAATVLDFAGRHHVPVAVSTSQLAKSAADMVAEVSPSVVLVKVTLAPPAPARIFNYQFSAQHAPATTTAERPRRAPVLTRQEVYQAHLAVDSSGKIIDCSQKQLPFLLGYYASIGIEPLSENGAREWEVLNVVQLEVFRSDESGMGIPGGFGGIAGGGGSLPGLGFGGSRLGLPSRFGGRGVKLYEASERTTYQLLSNHGTELELLKEYELVVPEDKPGAAARIGAKGRGKGVFDLQRGMMQSMDYSVTVAGLQVLDADELPLRLTYELKPDSIRKQLTAEQKAELARQYREEAERNAATAGAGLPANNPAVAAPPPGLKLPPPPDQNYPRVSDVQPSPRLDKFQPD
jgi:serine protease Do